MKQNVHVKPEPDGKWGVYKFNIFESFIDDLKRSGARVAIENFFVLLFRMKGS